MKIKITETTDLNCFSEDLNCEKIVYAIFKKNKNYYYLIQLDIGVPLFVKNNKNILVIDDYIQDWIYTKKFIDDYTNPYEGIISLRDLYCPQWMLDDKSFFFEVFLDKKLAQKKFLSKM